MGRADGAMGTPMAGGGRLCPAGGPARHRSGRGPAVGQRQHRWPAGQHGGRPARRPRHGHRLRRCRPRCGVATGSRDRGLARRSRGPRHRGGGVRGRRHTGRDAVVATRCRRGRPARPRQRRRGAGRPRLSGPLVAVAAAGRRPARRGAPRPGPPRLAAPRLGPGGLRRGPGQCHRAGLRPR
ncbi:hypothetical protein SDC9_144058 [bioreactor metagenome]|uniref:Uncharacterized protein n=1 Tax=bioreactor metagenome TaxID=1076179 RepID=A0A645E8D1_9ZZZZ